MPEPEVEIDVNLLMQAIRRDIARGRVSRPPGKRALRLRLTSTKLTTPEQVRLHELLGYHDAKFISHAYISVLLRSPDPAGFEHYLADLRSGTRSKIEILASLRYSVEGRAKAVRIRGLLVRSLGAKLFRVPYLGFPIRLAHSLFRLPNVVRQLRTLEAAHHATQSDDSTLAPGAFEASFDDVREKLDALAWKVDEINASSLDADERNRLDDVIAVVPSNVYAAIEARFRGTRHEIGQKLAHYLPVVDALDAALKTLPMLDLGCGRGEWLELMSRAGFRVSGVDVNPEMVNTCSTLGLAAQHADAISHLRETADNSLSCVTGFHIIEHMPFPHLLDLLNESYRVLNPGGIIIFETPNPENVTVGAFAFYLDPTHRNPLPPQLTEFLVQYTGFEDVEIMRVNAHSFEQPVHQEPAMEFISAHYHVAPDYAVVAHKPQPSPPT